MIRFYSSMDHPGQWIAYVPESGWMAFPDSEKGWEERKAVRGLDPIHLREVPVRLAVHAGLQAVADRPILKRVA